MSSTIEAPDSPTDDVGLMTLHDAVMAINEVVPLPTWNTWEVSEPLSDTLFVYLEVRDGESYGDDWPPERIGAEVIRLFKAQAVSNPAYEELAARIRWGAGPRPVEAS